MDSKKRNTSFVKGDKNAGRKKGSKNKITTEFKAMVQLALDELGPDTFIAWAKKNPGKFYSIIALKMIPNQVKAEVSGRDGEPLTIQVINYADVEKENKS